MSKLVPENRQARRVEGTSVTVVHESAPGGMRKIRCPGSHQLAVPMRATDGSTVLRTQNGRSYVTKKLGK